MVSARKGSRSGVCPQNDVPTWIETYENLHIDIGTGDGTYALMLARQYPGMAVIGIDTCLDNLTKPARRALPNLRFVTCDAVDVPSWLRGTATSVSINFPYGSLFHAVAAGERATFDSLLAVARPAASIGIRVNTSAGVEYGVTLDALHARIGRMVQRIAPRTASVIVVPHGEMRAFPTTWAKRLAYGRPSQVVIASARMGV